jgi:hypothetical protein
MKRQSITAALLSTVLIAGCSDRSNQNAATSDQAAAGTPQEFNQADDTSAQARREAVSPDRDTSAAGPSTSPDTRGARSTTGVRQAPAPREVVRNSDRAGTAARAERNAARSETTEAAPARRVPTFRELTLPSGTSLPLELTTALSSETAAVETPVRARVREAVTVDGYTAIPAGAVLTGTVTDVASAGRVQGRSRLTFRFDEVQLNGSREDLRTNPITFQGAATKGEDATKIGVGAGIGAAIGGIVGGAKGAAKGAAIGGAGGTGVVLATKGKEVEVGSGADVTAVLAAPLSVRVPVR